MAEKYSKGSILPFVAVGVVLVIALAVVLYTVRLRGDAAKIASQPSVQGAPQPPAGQSPENANPPANESKEDNSSTSQAQPKDSETSTSGTSGSSSGSLPQTGPQDVVLSLVAALALAYVAASYVQSRRQLERLL